MSDAQSEKFALHQILYYHVTDIDDQIRNCFKIEIQQADLDFLKNKLTFVLRNSRQKGVYAYPHIRGIRLPEMSEPVRLKQYCELNFSQLMLLNMPIIFHRFTVAEPERTGVFISRHQITKEGRYF